MISGFHSIIYSDDPDATRAFFRDVLEWPHVDAGEGWLIFRTPPSEIGVHPSVGDRGEQWATIPKHEVSFMCDDVEATVAELKAKGVDVDDEIVDQGYGLVTSLSIPGAGRLHLYQPRYPLPPDAS